MFDNIINNAKGSLNMIIMFFVGAFIGFAVNALVTGAGFDIQATLQFAVASAVAGFATALVMGCIK